MQVTTIYHPANKIVPEGTDEAIKGTKSEGTNMCPYTKVLLCTLRGYCHRDNVLYLLRYQAVPFFRDCNINFKEKKIINKKEQRQQGLADVEATWSWEEANANSKKSLRQTASTGILVESPHLRTGHT